MLSSLASLSPGFHPPTEMSSHCITCQKSSAISCQRKPITVFSFLVFLKMVVSFLPVFVCVNAANTEVEEEGVLRA